MTRDEFVPTRHDVTYEDGTEFVPTRHDVTLSHDDNAAALRALEGKCGKCGETFIRMDEDDDTHLERADGTPCYGRARTEGEAPMSTAMSALRHHVSGAVARGESEPIVAIESSERTKQQQDKRRELDQALIAVHSDIHKLLEEVGDKADAVDPETANWGHVGDLQRIASKLRDALGEEGTS